MEKILQNDYIQVSADNLRKAVFIEWFAETERMSAEVFKAVLLEVADYVKEHHIKSWLGNTLQFRFLIIPELQDWTAQVLNMRLKEAGLEKMALLIPAEIFANVGVQQTVDEMATSNKDLTVRYFDKVSDAETWLFATA